MLKSPVSTISRRFSGSERKPRAAEERREDFRERTYGAEDGLRLYFRDYGDALSPRLPVLCLPGLTRNSKDYHKLALRLAPERRVLCPDYRGRGRSAYDPDWHNYAPTVYVNDLRHLLAATNVHRAVIIGTSMGAFLAMGLSLMMPMAVAAVVLNDAGPDLHPKGLARILGYIGTDRPQADWDSAARTLREMLPGLSIDTDEGWRDFARNTYREGEDGLLHFDWDTNLARPLRTGTGDMPDLWALFRSLRRIPVLALRGENSDLLSAETFERMGEVIPAMARVIVPNTGHAPTLAEPAAAQALDEFLAQF